MKRILAEEIEDRLTHGKGYGYTSMVPYLSTYIGENSGISVQMGLYKMELAKDNALVKEVVPLLGYLNEKMRDFQRIKLSTSIIRDVADFNELLCEYDHNKKEQFERRRANYL